MKKVITFSLITAIVALMSNCAPKVAKTAAKPETKKEERATGTTGNSGTSGNLVKDAQGDRTNEEQIKLLAQTNDARLDAGANLYESNCGKCHDLHSPGSRNANSWVEVMKVMGPKAKLEVSSYLTISAYLVKNAKG